MAAALVLISGGCTLSGSNPPAVGDPVAGADIIAREACGSCHHIPLIPLANGVAGPPLDGIAGRVYIAGHLLNKPQNMVLWLRNPQSVVPENAMPDMGLTETEAADVAAYLYTLR